MYRTCPDIRPQRLQATRRPAQKQSSAKALHNEKSALTSNPGVAANSLILRRISLQSSLQQEVIQPHLLIECEEEHKQYASSLDEIQNS